MFVPIWMLILVGIVFLGAYAVIGYALDLLANSDQKTLWTWFSICFWPVGVLFFFSKWFIEGQLRKVRVRRLNRQR